MQSILAPSAHIAVKSRAVVAELYPKMRWQILHSTFIGYASYYFVRNNLSPVQSEFREALSYSNDQIGNLIAATSVAYGVGKFVVGAWSDRSNPRYFMAIGLFLTAICNFLFGMATSYPVHLALWLLNGFFQAAGWPPCGRSLGHWFSLGERGKIFAYWNISHNVGGALIGIVAVESFHYFGSWQYAFFVPGVLALLGSAYILYFLRDTPQSEGLPSVEDYRGDQPPIKNLAKEKELPFKALFLDYVLKNPIVWTLAIANFFVYICRYSMLDWGPTFLKEVKGADLRGGGASVFLFEMAGIPSTILMGILSDKLSGRRGLVSLLCMIPVSLAFLVIILNPPGHLMIDYTCLAVIGFFIYPPIMLLAVAGLDVTSKKAVGTAAGFIGLFGYIGRTVQAKVLGWCADLQMWNYALGFILISALATILVLILTARVRPSA